jgi:hypothetical protein
VSRRYPKHSPEAAVFRLRLSSEIDELSSAWSIVSEEETLGETDALVCAVDAPARGRIFVLIGGNCCWNDAP